MPARNSNDATSYVLRYPEDFQARSPANNVPEAPFAIPSSPFLGPELFYDEARGTLELLPEVDAGEREAALLPGLAVDLDGVSYRSDAWSGKIWVRRCDGSETSLLCEPSVLAQPAGLALDRRGLLFVADPAARRVVVLAPEDGSVVAVLDGTLDEPVDVAVTPTGRVAVADRSGGRIALFGSRFTRLGSFVPRNAAGLPATPRPIALMIEPDGSLLVADASHPRLLHFDPFGAPLADVELVTVASPLVGGELALRAFEHASGSRQPRFLVGACCPLPEGDGGTQLAALHRTIRLLSLGLGRRFAARGVFVSAALDSGTPGTIWHRIDVEAALPAGASLLMETATSESATPDSLDWQAPHDARGQARPVSPEVPEQLVQSAPGRYAWVRLTLTSDGTTTPSVHALRILYPRVSYLGLLPGVFQRDAEGALFLQHFLALFERVFTRVEDRYEAFTRELDPDGAPADILVWLAKLVDLTFDPSWPIERRRELTKEAVALYAIRGTPRGIERFVEIYTGVRPLVTELFLERPARPAFLGRPGSVLGCGLPLLAPSRTPDSALYEPYAHRFVVYVYADDRCDEDVLRSVVNAIVELNKPAHTAHELRLVYPDLRVGVQSTVGVDLVVGAASPPVLQLGGAGEPAGTLGIDTVLGERRPGYPRERPLTLD